MPNTDGSRQCDKAAPACGQCRRQGTDCPGYRDLLSLSFRNETARVVGKEEARRAASGSAKQTSHESASSLQDYNFTSPTSTALALFAPPLAPRLLHSGIELGDLGLTCFYYNLASSPGDPFETLLSLAPKVLSTDRYPKAMAAAMRSISLAGVANSAGTQVDQAGLSRRAFSEYGAALRAVNKALADPTSACKDSTLFAILLLSIFESFTCLGPTSVTTWKRHIDGASALIAQRGAAQFEREVGLLAFREALVHIFTMCYRLGVPVPPQICAMRQRITCRFGPSNTIWLMSSAHMDAIDLWQRSVSHQWPLPADLWQRLLLEAMELDRRNISDFELFVELGGHDGHFKTIFDSHADPDLVYKGIHHVYPSMQMARCWTGMRACRLLLYRLMRALVKEAGPDVSFAATGSSQSELLAHTEHELCELVMALIASMPQLLGYISPDGALASRRSAKAHVAGSYHAMFHLYHAGQAPGTDDSVRQWAVRQLRDIGSQTGIRKAGYLADLLEGEGCQEY